MRTIKSLAFAALVCTSGIASAQTASLGLGNLGITGFTFSVSGRTITLNETWTRPGPGSVEITGLDTGNYTVIKNITNNTGFIWTSFANELLDPVVDAGDPAPQPGFVPVGFSTSNDGDGLSFAQGSGLPRTSDIFTSVLADELSDARDFLDFSGNQWGNGVNGFITFGLRDSGPNQPFLLFQRPNEFSTTQVPVPAALPLLLAGLGVFGFAARRKQKA